MNMSIYAHAWQDDELQIEINDSQGDVVVNIDEVHVFMTIAQTERLARALEVYLLDRDHVEAIKMNSTMDMLAQATRM
jgi:hypothetical protein